ncbi:glycosyltransferase [uncultured Roseobacter sp.]|uniref:glycosyltransferase family 2 protein n=1 Tax=uncultured Roseobacter sp. TaxID=114847 RepID=UPI0026137440|nr:glycosyltransferase [uncultured Roseobacter sp.]
MSVGQDIGAVVIGRNEGQRLIDCLTSLEGQVSRIIYVDSGSTDGSQEAAQTRGVEVITLDTTIPFTAARARNAGLARLTETGSAPALVQFMDGDCVLDPDWIAAATGFLDAHPEVAVVCGRRRERFPDATVFNRLIDQEWDTPIGEARSCGGDALMRVAALTQVGGYNPGLIAGEEPELCVRMRAAGWKVWRLDHEMTLHDAAITRVGQWWQRTRRAGHAYAEGAALHGAPPERHNIAPLRRALLWGVVLPGLTLLALLIWLPLGVFLLLIWPLQVLRLRRRYGDTSMALAMTFGKLAEAQGALTYWWRRLIGKRSRLIEYK